MRVFLGGTCNNSDWREKLIPLLEECNIDYFNPVVDDWNDSAKAMEELAKKECDVHLYTITPLMTGVYSIAELVHDSVKDDEYVVIFTILTKDGDLEFDTGQLKSLEAVSDLLKPYGVLTVRDDLDKLVKCLVHISVHIKDPVM